VVNQVIHDEAAQHGDPRHGEDLVIPLLHRPLRHHHRVGLGVDLLAPPLDVVVERLEHAGDGFRVLLAGVLAECREIQYREIAGEIDPVRDVGDVAGQPAEAE